MDTGYTQMISHLKSTLNSEQVGGIIPTEALSHHQRSMPLLLQKVLQAHNGPIDLVAVTRGPGMVGSLSVGLNLAKGVAIGLSTPLVGIHHMLGHLLIPRMNQQDNIKFPLLSLLVSGGHTMLVRSQDILHHEILIDTIDIAIGDSMDKCGRALGIKANMIAKEMEQLASKWDGVRRGLDVNLPNPLSSSHNKNKLSFSFAPFITSLNNQLGDSPPLNDENRLYQLAYEIQEAHFDHLIYKIKQWMVKYHSDGTGFTFVASGGVSSNQRLRNKLLSELKDYFPSFRYPSNNELCIDNAIMIGWAAIELQNHFKSHGCCNIANTLDILPMRKWDLTDLITRSDWVKDSCK